MLTPRAADVALFRDWCHGSGTDPSRATWDQAARFLIDCPTTDTNKRRRAAAALSTCAAAGNPLRDPNGAPDLPPLARDGDEWLHLHEALDRIPVWGWPRGFTGRRDGFILIAAAQGLDRPALVALTALDVERRRDCVTLNGEPVPTTPSAGTCPACRVWLWAQALTAVADTARAGGIRAVTEGITERADQHVCEIAVPPGTGPVPMVVSVDQHGWIGDRPLNGSSISRILTARLSERAPILGRDERSIPVVARRPARAPGESWERDRLDDLTQAEDDLDELADALQDRAADLLRQIQDSQQDVTRLVDDAWS